MSLKEGCRRRKQMASDGGGSSLSRKVNNEASVASVVAVVATDNPSPSNRNNLFTRANESKERTAMSHSVVLRVGVVGKTVLHATCRSIVQSHKFQADDDKGDKWSTRWYQRQSRVSSRRWHYCRETFREQSIERRPLVSCFSQVCCFKS